MSWSLFTTDIVRSYRFVLLQSLHPRLIWTRGFTCYNCELKNTHQLFYFLLFFVFFTFFTENCTLWTCVNEISRGLLHIRHAVYVEVRECHIFAAFLYGPLFVWRSLVGSQGSENQPFFKLRKWTCLMKVISFWHWGQVYCYILQAFFNQCFFFVCFFARISCHWRTPTDILDLLAKCQCCQISSIINSKHTLNSHTAQMILRKACKA